MAIRSRRLATVLLTLAAACGQTSSTPKVSPFPGLTVTGSVLDVRGGVPVAGAHVVIWNEFDTGSANTAADGTFSLIVDGSSSTSYLRVTQAGYRPYQASISVTSSSTSAGARRIVSKDEVLFSTVAGDIYMIRAGGGGTLISIAATGDSEVSPARDESGLTLRWADATSAKVMEGAWDGSGAHAVWTAPVGTSLVSLAWTPRATFVWTNNGAADAVVMAGEPSGAPNGFNYSWAGIQPDASPAAFGYFGPTAILGNMLAFVKGDGIYTAFPYFADSFLVPEKISSTAAADYYPAWSPLRASGTLDLAFNRGYTVFATRVSASGHANVWSTPTRLYGGVPGEASITDIAWAPETVGADDRLVLVVHPISAGGAFGAGDLVVLSWDPVAKAVTSGPTLLYGASGAVAVGKAANVSWR
jgi:hypothetical protein